MTRKGARAIVLAGSVAGAATILQLVVLGHQRPEPLIVSRLIKVDSREVDRHVVEDTYRAELTHAGLPESHDFAGVTARIVHPFGLPFPGNLQIVDGGLEFGSVPVGQTVESRDTITIRRHPNFPLKLHHLRWAVSAHPDLIPSMAWAGDWHLTVTSRDVATNDIVAVDAITETIGAREPFGFSLLPDFARCQWLGSDQVLEAECSARVRLDACVMEGSARFRLERDGAALAGHGDWAVIDLGDCGNTESGGESLEIVGVRVAVGAEPEPFSPGLLTMFASRPALVELIAEGLRAAARGGPESEEDCTRGAWRRFTTPAFRSARECQAFLQQHDSRRDDRSRR